MQKYNGETLFNNIRAVCEARGITLQALEKKIGFPVSNVLKWKNSDDTFAKVLGVAKALGVSMEYLLNSDFNKAGDTQNLLVEAVYVRTCSKDIKWDKIGEEDEKWGSITRCRRLGTDMPDKKGDMLDSLVSVFRAEADGVLMYCIRQKIFAKAGADSSYDRHHYYFAIELCGTLTFIEGSAHSIEKLYIRADDDLYDALYM